MKNDVSLIIQDVLKPYDANRIKFVPGKQDDVLWICFSSRGKKNFELFKTLVATKKNVLFINDNVDGYYHESIQGLCNNLHELTDLLKKISDIFCDRQIICIGSSMGAYGALLLGTAIKADKIIAFSPQINLNPILSLTPEENSKAAFNNITQDIINNQETKYYIFCSLMPEDLYHVIALKKLSHVQLNVLNTVSVAFGHNILAELSKNGYQLTDFFLKIINEKYLHEIKNYNYIINNKFIAGSIIGNVENFYQQNFDLCVNFFTKAFYLFPEWSQSAYYAVKSGNHEAGLLLKALTNSPQSYFLYFDLLSALANENRKLFDLYFEQALLMGNFNAEELLNKLQTQLNKNKKNDAALFIREKILAEYPENTSALYAHGLYYLHKKQYKKSHDFFTQVLILLENKQEDWRFSQAKTHMETICRNGSELDTVQKKTIAPKLFTPLCNIKNFLKKFSYKRFFP